MKKNLRAAPVCWDDYATLQAISDRSLRVDCKAWALDDQMDSCLSALDNEGSPPLTAGVNWLKNLEASRSQKYRNRCRVFQEEYAPSEPLEVECHKLRDLCNEETLAQVRAEVTAEELDIFQELADGIEYAIIADERNMTLAALKSQIYRCRARLRSIAQ